MASVVGGRASTAVAGGMAIDRARPPSSSR